MKYIASTIVRASDIGLNDNLFGGTLLRWLDEYGALFTYKYLNHKFVTYKMEKTYFLKSAKQGDCIDFYVTNLKFDKISVNFDLVAKINSYKPAKEIINTNMTFVAIDVEKEKPTRLNPMLFEIDEFEKFIYQKAKGFMSNDKSIFHNIYHIEDMINQLHMLKSSMKINEYKKVFLAACYHDAVHVPLMEDNEIKSVDVFNKDFGKIIDAEDFEDIKNMILSTNKNCQNYQIKEFKNADLIHDLDLISFIDYETMKNNDVKIRTEYSSLSTLEFFEFKLKYFKNLLEDKIFISSFYKKHNNVASNNIENYIKEIKQMIKEIKNAE